MKLFSTLLLALAFVGCGSNPTQAAWNLRVTQVRPKAHGTITFTPSIFVYNYADVGLSFDTVSPNCTPWVPASGLIGPGLNENLAGTVQQCDAEVNFSATNNPTLTCKLYWTGDLFTLTQAGETDCTMYPLYEGIELFYKLK